MYTDTFPSMTFDQFVSNFIQILLTSTPLISDTSVGSIPLAFAEATAGNDLALQELIYHVYNVARLGTSEGSDVDSYVGDFGLTRDPATYASNVIYLNRTGTVGVQAEPLGSVVQAPVGNVQFELVADTTQASYDPVNMTYFFADGQGTIPVRVQALNAGSASNVGANSISQIVSGLVGVSSISQPVAIDNAVDAETDDELRTRFQLFIESLSKATETSVEEAIDSVQPGLTYKLIEYFHFDGSPFVGGFTAVVDDGSGSISSSLLTEITAAIDAVRAAGIAFEVKAPTDVPVNVVVNIKAAPGYSSAIVTSALSASITSYVNKLGVGNNVSLANLANAINTTQVNGANIVFSYTNLMVNGAVADFVIAPTQLARIGSITITVQ